MNRFLNYLKDTRAEMKHVAWPNTRQTAVYTGVVILIAAITALYLFIFDTIFIRILELFIVR
ncbi:MAG: preprotein translocase subunit SecE [Candidatus Vogelbacteria bacterium CG10_big_fil_rev_8_21_14_0_10_45_14]|uniref:Protein translocase subunit SecE n=1 Tax=Candidatus Vogelbacteria bacterium CG10_big_fil_rev_8_21_14_0_10_45_14 TaxID=1975042 RepID=A0A2H0RML8_9BACT|nr:MAG: preprotein translocase subunit SecE [Candidatus Vogelbacteria bacterium CG10_big_fil_rev_8_21_14_0_10_45_14]